MIHKDWGGILESERSRYNNSFEMRYNNSLRSEHSARRGTLARRETKGEPETSSQGGAPATQSTDPFVERRVFGYRHNNIEAKTVSQTRFANNG